MSQSGSYTPLQVNTLSQLQNDSGFTINPVVQTLIGVYSPQSYQAGTVVNDSVLNRLTAALPNIYKMATIGQIQLSTYRNLLSIGSSLCPALGNSKPATFKPSYPGYGSWQDGVLASDSYPPKGYPASGAYSYINQAYGNYAYVTGWPGRSSWQKETDEYVAAFVPANNTAAAPDYDRYFSNGFVSCVAQQAYNELFTGQFNQYSGIVNATQLYNSATQVNNTQIASVTNSKTYLSGNFSNINDLTTNDLSGVNQSFRIWGNDLINTGKVIDLSNIHKFGTPSILLLTLQKYGALTPAVGLALQYAGLTTSDLSKICAPTYTPTPAEEKKIYEAFTYISGNDLYGLNQGVTLQLNCRLNNLRTLADLLDPQYLFPNSYLGLTIPQYRADTTTSKTYYFIYTNGGVNPQVKQLSEPLASELAGIIPESIALACAAFSVSMQQVKNIMQASIEKFALAVVDLELTNLNLPEINTATGTAVNISAANQLLGTIALGSGNSGTFQQCDFMGAASGYPYTTWLASANDLLTKLPTQQLQQTYQQLFQLSLTPPVPPIPPATDPLDPILDAAIQALINTANGQIDSIYNSNTDECEALNNYWNYVGNQLFISQRAIPYAIPSMTGVVSASSTSDFQSFVQNIDTYAQQNEPGSTGSVLSAIANRATLGGQSILGCMRESRNAVRLAAAGIPPENDISSSLQVNAASAEATLDGNGSITGVVMTSTSSGYSLANPPRVDVYPFGYQAALVPVIEADGSISSLYIANSGRGMPYVEIVIDPPPTVLPPNREGNSTPPTGADQPTFPGPGPFTGFSGNPYLPGLLVPLAPSDNATPTIPETIDDVSKCNCDCWNL
jgi:hypothetical protein